MKLLLSGLLILSIVITESSVMASGTLTTHKYIASNMNTQNCTEDSSEMYSSELNRVELHLYHKIYPKQTLANRLGRIERTVFHQTYPHLTYTERVNNILSCYQDVYNMKNFVSNYYSPNLFRRMYSRYNGYPTGLTPAISPSILNNGYLNGLNGYNGYHNMYYGNRGYRYNNVMSPMVGAGVRILD